MPAKTTRSSRRRRLAADLSPEVVWYLESRGYELPTVVPRVRTPEPRQVPGAVFDPDEVDRKIAALKHLRHTQGKWAGRPIVPAPVQVAYIIAPVFGWRRRVGGRSGRLVRIIRDLYVEMPRKGAKTTLAASLAMLLAFADGESGAQVLLGAASKDQAGAAFKPLKAVASASDMLRRAGVRPLASQIVQDSTSSVVKVVSSRGDLAHGANVYCSLIDELHVHRKPDLLEALESGTGAREQPLGIIITTADDGQVVSVYAQRRRMIEQVASRTIKAPTMYGVVFAADDDDDPFAEETIAKANPLYPETPNREFMAAAVDKARANPAALASFQRLHLGIRANQDSRYLDLHTWDRNAGIVIEDRLKGRPCFGGLDLASTADLCALCWLFPADDGSMDALWRHWIPERGFDRLNKATMDTAQVWRRNGLLTVTPGDVADYDFILAQIRTDMAAFGVQGIGYDPWNASSLVNDLVAEEAPMVQVRQGYATLSPALKQIGHLLGRGTARSPMFRHGGNQLMRWQVNNLAVATDAAGNIKPDKRRSVEKIDGLAAACDAMAVQLAAEEPDESAYADGHDPTWI